MLSYDTLGSLKLLKRYTPYKLRKTLAEALILSAIDYGSVVYQNVPKFLIKRLQKFQTISAGYVLNRYAEECDVIKLGWLPIIERFEFKTTKLAFKALHCPEWPDYLPLNFINQITELHLGIVMITNYPTLKIKTYSNLMFTGVLMICH